MNASKLQPGEQVETRFAGCLTQHTIKERKVLGKRVLLRVFPPVPKSTGDWIGADHFRPAGERKLSRRAKLAAFAVGVLVVAACYVGLVQSYR